jgi:hypothetical protein
MKHLQKGWVRVVVSLLCGGLISEIIHISTGDPNREPGSESSFIVLIVAVVAYFIITKFINNDKPPRLNKLK